MPGLSWPDGKRLPFWPIVVPTAARGPKCNRRGFRPAMLNHLVLNRLAIAHVNTEVRGSMTIRTRLTITPAGLREIGRGNRNG